MNSKLCFIIGTGYCGSTHVDLSLAKVLDYLPLGEVKSFWNTVQNDALCTCLKKISACPFWRPIISGLESQISDTDQSNFQISRAIHRKMQDLLNCRYYSDASKDPDYVRRLIDCVGSESKIIWVHRPEREFIGSMCRRGFSQSEASRFFHKRVAKCEAIFNNSKNDSLFVDYSLFLQNQETTITEIAIFLGFELRHLSYKHEPKNENTKEIHYISGSLHRFSLLHPSVFGDSLR